MDCPKRYGAYDVMCRDCEECNQGKLYQTCRVGMDHFACSGWLDLVTAEPLCCEHYKEKYSNEGSNKS